MSAFDVVALVILAVSAGIGLMRGAVRELVGLLAFVLAALATILLFPFAAPVARALVHPPWLGSALAAVLLFVAVFVGLRLAAGALSARLDRSPVFGPANRVGGLLFGAVRALVLLGLFALVFARTTPADLQPTWITASAAYPVARASGRALQAFLPAGLRLAGRLPGLKRRRGEALPAADGAVPEARSADPPPPPAPPEAAGASTHARRSRRAPPFETGGKSPDDGYTTGARDSVDALVERAK